MPTRIFNIRKQRYLRHCLAVLLLSLFSVACSTGGGKAGTPNGPNLTPEQLLYQSPSEMELTWQASLVSIPTRDGGVVRTTVSALESGEVVPDQTYPVVIYLHGCSGFWSGSSFRINWLAQNGFVVIAPNSFAREFYPQSCNPSTNESGLFRPTLAIRQFDAGYSIKKAAEFTWADKNNIMLVGFSEGAAVATTYTNLETPAGLLKARVAEAWVCQAGWPEFQGINAPESEAVLTLVSDRDPWYTSRYHQGDCGEFMTTNNGSLSYVVDYEPLRNRHELWEQPEIQEIIRTFLLEQLSRP